MDRDMAMSNAEIGVELEAEIGCTLKLNLFLL